ncbi:hypothetical protein PRIPAC_87749 [Pristionchus pacificus]|uniref:Uncharacterized protein n=1 Tax=Pristionchus pacificus TaxID=54126 RepID=A0A2A6B994_PRIPA|nr:hypothetical protein PRIPAC_87749 [Pristionchus pacificus]|eukprot:PDM62433.1 hypothetical protein PRIPAC_51875 [Pristionchus pacificus]
MALTRDVKMPSDAELTVPQEITISTPYLKAVGPYMHMHCEAEIKVYMLRRRELEDPRATLKEGAAVTACGVRFLQSLKKNCAEQTKAFADCIDHGSSKLYVSKCRAEQAKMDQCVEEQLHIKRPALGYFSKPMVYESAKPRPVVVQRDYKAEAAKVIAELPEEYHLRSDYRNYRDWRYNVAVTCSVLPRGSTCQPAPFPRFRLV